MIGCEMMDLNEPLRVWIVTIGEPIPIGDEISDRLLRSGLLADVLAARGHQVVWWTSTFDHMRKRHRFTTDTSVYHKPNLEIRLVRGSGYRSNISLRRLIDQALLAKSWTRWARRDSPPALIVCSMPPIELAAATSRYGRHEGVPVLIDIRDLWPDAFVDVLPRNLRFVAGPLLAPWRLLLRRSLSTAAAITGTSNQYLAWAQNVCGRKPSDIDQVFPLGFQAAAVMPQEVEVAENRLLAQGVDPQKTICWFVGAFGATYDLTTVIETARRIERDSLAPNVQFVLSGDGPSAPTLRREAAGLRNVVFTGWLDRVGLTAMANLASIGLAAYTPGAPQSLPNKLFEYLHAGLPVITSLGQESMQVLDEGRCGAAYQAGDQESLAGVITELARNPDKLNLMSTCATNIFNSRFRAEEIYEAMANFVENIARCHTTVPPVPEC